MPGLRFASTITLPASVAVGTGVGNAVGGAIAPVVRQLQNESWKQYLFMPLLPIQAAQVVASGERPMEWGIEESTNSGINEERFRALVDIFDTAPDLSTLYDLLNRGLIGEAAFREGARKQNIEAEWMDALIALRRRVLSPAEAANAWQQGYMSEAEASAEAALSGVTPDRSLIQRQTAGLPPGAMDSLGLLRRGLIDESTYRQIVREGHTKVKYTDALLGLRNQVLNATQAASLWLKGWLTEPEAKRIGALTGYDSDAMDLLYKDRGRPATVRQAHIGFARGGRLPEAGNDEKATIRRSVEQSNIRTEWFDILYSQRFTYPSAFVIRALASDGTFAQPLVEQILVESGWKPEWAELASEKWAGGTAGVSTKWADRARSRVFTEAWSDYLDGNANEAELRELLAAVGAVGAEQTAIVALATAVRDRTRTDLTKAEIFKLYKKTIWNRDRAQAALEDIGMDAADATDLLVANQPPPPG